MSWNETSSHFDFWLALARATVCVRRSQFGLIIFFVLGSLDSSKKKGRRKGLSFKKSRYGTLVWNTSMEFMYGTLEWKICVWNSCMEIPPCLVWVGRILIKVFFLGCLKFVLWLVCFWLNDFW